MALPQSIEDRIEQCRIALPPISELRKLVKECGHPNNVSYQLPLISAALRHLLNGREPHRQQVRVVRRLVYQLGDTLLAAKTGFGKSITLHAYSVLTGYITLQIIPLSKLGGEQLDTIQRYDGASPCLVTAETKHVISKHIPYH